MSLIDEVKQKTDIVEVISQYASLNKAGRTFRALCPFHSEKHPSFFVYPEQQSWHCFGACNTGGDVFSFVMKKQGIDFGEALRLLAARVGVTVPSKFKLETGGEEKERLYQINEAAAQYFHDALLNLPAGEKARNYISNRDISAQTITDFQLGFSPNSWEALKQHLTEIGYAEDELRSVGLIIEAESGKTHDRFRNRLMFPIYDAKGKIIGFGARALDDSLPKYLNSPQTPVFDKSSSLYGINLAATAIRQQDTAVIVEGYMDTITAHQNGFSNVVASMGTSVTEKQVSTLKRLTKNITLALDADVAGEEAMLRGIDYENMLDTEVKVILLPNEKDPDDVIKGDTTTWQKLVNEAIPVVDYIFNMVTAKLDLTTARDKSTARDHLLPIISKMKDVVRQAHYLQKLSRLINVSERTLEVNLRSFKTSQARQSTQKQEREISTVSTRPILSNPLEDYCLALLLQHPELKNKGEALLPEYFENSENREIFIAWHQTDDLMAAKDMLDIAIHEHFDSLITRNLPVNQIEPKYTECALRLREKHLRSLEAIRAEIFTLAVESGGAGADLARLQEEGIEPSVQLGEVFNQKYRRGQEQRR